MVIWAFGTEPTLLRQWDSKTVFFSGYRVVERGVPTDSENLARE